MRATSLSAGRLCGRPCSLHSAECRVAGREAGDAGCVCDELRRWDTRVHLGRLALAHLTPSRPLKERCA